MIGHNAYELVGLGLTLVGMTSAFIFALFKVRDSLSNQFSKKFESLTSSVDALKVQANDTSGAIRRETGEAYTALRTKAHEIEMEVLRLERDMFDKFVRRESFKEGMDRMEKAIGEGLRDLKQDLKGGIEGLNNRMSDLSQHGKKP